MRKSGIGTGKQIDTREYALITPPKGSFLPGWALTGLRDGRNPLPRVRVC